MDSPFQELFKYKLLNLELILAYTNNVNHKIKGEIHG